MVVKHTGIGNGLVCRKQELPQGDPIIDLQLQRPGFQRNNDFLGDAVLGVGATLVKRDAADVWLSQMIIQIILGGEPLETSGAGKGARISLNRGMVRTDVFSRKRRSVSPQPWNGRTCRLT